MNANDKRVTVPELGIEPAGPPTLYLLVKHDAKARTLDIASKLESIKGVEDVVLTAGKYSFLVRMKPGHGWIDRDYINQLNKMAEIKQIDGIALIETKKRKKK